MNLKDLIAVCSKGDLPPYRIVTAIDADERFSQ